jgi:hypothetical protein
MVWESQAQFSSPPQGRCQPMRQPLLASCTPETCVSQQIPTYPGCLYKQPSRFPSRQSPRAESQIVRPKLLPFYIPAQHKMHTRRQLACIRTCDALANLGSQGALQTCVTVCATSGPPCGLQSDQGGDETDTTCKARFSALQCRSSKMCPLSAQACGEGFRDSGLP